MGQTSASAWNVLAWIGLAVCLLLAGVRLVATRLLLGSDLQSWLMFSLAFAIYTLPITVSTACIWRICARIPPGNCQSCGYNLTGNESGKCPECSTPVPKREATA